jgi:hypothetical protein
MLSQNHTEAARMGQRSRILSQIGGVRGWNVVEVYFEAPGGKRVVAVAGYDLPAEPSW